MPMEIHSLPELLDHVLALGVELVGQLGDDAAVVAVQTLTLSPSPSGRGKLYVRETCSQLVEQVYLLDESFDPFGDGIEGFASFVLLLVCRWQRFANSLAIVCNFLHK